MPQPSDLPQPQHCLARALYDNVPDSPDELAFRKGDTLIVLEQNTGNIEGWWLCTLKGRQGICPANRLRLIPGVYEDSGNSRVSSPQFGDMNNDFILQRPGIRRNWSLQPNQVVTPKKFNDVYLYDMPPRSSPLAVSSLSPRDSTGSGGSCGGGSGGGGDYDVPPRAVPLGNDSFRNCPRCSPAPSCASPVSRESGETYDIPRSLHNPLTPSSSASSLTADSLSSSNRSSLVNMPDYDIPRPHPRTVQPQTTTPHQQQQQQQIYDIPPAHQQPLKELPLELHSALETLERLQIDTTGSISKLLLFVGTNWRSPAVLKDNIMEIKLAVTRLKTSLHDLADFGEGTLGNAAKASDKNLVGKLNPLVMAIKKADHIVQEACTKLDRVNWSVDFLSRSSPSEERKDELEQLVVCAKVLTEDIRQIASFIQGNGLLLFKADKTHNIEWVDEHDYVSLESKDSLTKSRLETLHQLPPKLQKGYSDCVKNADDEIPQFEHSEDDKQLLTFFAAQLVNHHSNLMQAIDAFLECVEHNQPPKVFLAHGKFVVLSAHKLVHIGDTVHRNVQHKEVKERALACSNALSEALARSVNKTKQAAHQFPSVGAVQEMVNSVVEISHLARDLKVSLLQPL